MLTLTLAPNTLPTLGAPHCRVRGEKLSESAAPDVRQLCSTLLNAYLVQVGGGAGRAGGVWGHALPLFFCAPLVAVSCARLARGRGGAQWWTGTG